MSPIFLIVTEPFGDEWATRSSIALLVPKPAKTPESKMVRIVFILWLTSCLAAGRLECGWCETVVLMPVGCGDLLAIWWDPSDCPVVAGGAGLNDEFDR